VTLRCWTCIAAVFHRKKKQEKEKVRPTSGYREPTPLRLFSAFKVTICRRRRLVHQAQILIRWEIAKLHCRILRSFPQEIWRNAERDLNNRGRRRSWSGSKNVLTTQGQDNLEGLESNGSQYRSCSRLVSHNRNRSMNSIRSHSQVRRSGQQRGADVLWEG
jgi:hypothetical protein